MPPRLDLHLHFHLGNGWGEEKVPTAIKLNLWRCRTQYMNCYGGGECVKENSRAAVNHLSRRKISGPKNCQPTSSFGGEKMIDPSHGLFYFVLDRSEETQCFIVNCVILTQPRNHISLLCLHLLKSLALAWKCCWDKRVSCPVAEDQEEERQSQDRMVNQVTAARQTQLG